MGGTTAKALMVDKALQYSKASYPIEVRLSGRVMEDRAGQLLKASYSIEVRLSGSVTEVKASHEEKVR